MFRPLSMLSSATSKTQSFLSQSKEDIAQPEEQNEIQEITNVDDVMSTLTDLDANKVKQDIHITKDIIYFLKKRASIEEEYGKQMIKLSQSMAESFTKNNPTLNTYGNAWISFLETHEKIGEQKIKLSTDIIEVADDAQIMCKDIEKSRKQAKELGIRHEKERLDSEGCLEKCKQKYDLYTEEWEKNMISKNSITSETSHRKSGIFKSNKTSSQIQKLIDESSVKAHQSHIAYKNQLVTTNAIRRDYFETLLPSDLITMKSIDDECCTAIRYQLARYAYLFEESLVSNGLALDNDEGDGLRSAVEKIKYNVDFANNVHRFSKKAKKFTKQDIPYKEYKMSSIAISVLKPNPVFGVDLIRLMERDKTEVPLVLVKCVEAIEDIGLDTNHIYQTSGNKTQILQLKDDFDKNYNVVNLRYNENSRDVNNISNLLKLWLQELPNSLIPQSAMQHFLNAANIENNQMRVLGLHTIINDLPDAHYSSLKYLVRHLYKVLQHQDNNQMNSIKLANVFYRLFTGRESKDFLSNQSSSDLNGEAQLDNQNLLKAVQTIIENYMLIFEPDEE